MGAFFLNSTILYKKNHYNTMKVTDKKQLHIDEIHISIKSGSDP